MAGFAPGMPDDMGSLDEPGITPASRHVFKAGPAGPAPGLVSVLEHFLKLPEFLPALILMVHLADLCIGGILLGPARARSIPVVAAQYPSGVAGDKLSPDHPPESPHLVGRRSSPWPRPADYPDPGVGGARDVAGRDSNPAGSQPWSVLVEEGRALAAGPKAARPPADGKPFSLWLPLASGRAHSDGAPVVEGPQLSRQAAPPHSRP